MRLFNVGAFIVRIGLLERVPLKGSIVGLYNVVALIVSIRFKV